MIDDEQGSEQSIAGGNKPRSFSLRELFVFIALVGVAVGWYVDRNRPTASEFYVNGPIDIGYTIRHSPKTTTSSRIEDADGIDLIDGQVVVHTSSGGIIFTKENLVRFNWSKQ